METIGKLEVLVSESEFRILVSDRYLSNYIVEYTAGRRNSPIYGKFSVDHYAQFTSGAQYPLSKHPRSKQQITTGAEICIFTYHYYRPFPDCGAIVVYYLYLMYSLHILGQWHCSRAPAPTRD